MAALTKREILRRKSSSASTASNERILPRPTFRATVQRHGLSGSELARLSGVSLRVVYNMFSPGNEYAQIGTTMITSNKIARALARHAGDLKTKEAWALLWEYEDRDTVRDIADSLQAYAETLTAMGMPHVATAMHDLAGALVSGDLKTIAPAEEYVKVLEDRAREADRIVAGDASTQEKACALRTLGLAYEEIGHRLGFSRAYAHELVSTSKDTSE